MNRRDFLATTGAGVLGASLLSPAWDRLLAQTQTPHAVWVENGEPAQLLAAALKEMGGISQFISRGDVVVVKPNMGWDRSAEQGANTHPLVVRSVVEECL